MSFKKVLRHYLGTRAGINVENCNFILNSRSCKVKYTKPISDKRGRDIIIKPSRPATRACNVLFDCKHAAL